MDANWSIGKLTNTQFSKVIPRDVYENFRNLHSNNNPSSHRCGIPAQTRERVFTEFFDENDRVSRNCCAISSIILSCFFQEIFRSEIIFE